ncbi:serine/threonine-protein kinase ATR-like [Lytechinus variegatus]|uniref:serine/threonine-protein kinase ATR-like n=1 Tax=Lytechinus variegatus TaxID=7654 RepID=UPI001BB13F31|nr:serine/threonine-protein kinase ATR-like [Lytechinus variegatus]
MASSVQQDGVAHPVLEDLKKEISQLGSMQVSSSQQRYRLIKIYRKTICRFTSDFLSNLDEVCNELAGNSSANSSRHCEVPLNFIQLCVNEKPLIFVGSDPPQESEDTNSSGSKNSIRTGPSDFYVAETLNRWLLCHLLQLLSEHACQSIHQQTSQIIVSLLHLIKFKEINTFYRFFNDLARLLAELMQINHEKFSDEDDDFPDPPFKVQHFTVDVSSSDNLEEHPEFKIITSHPRHIEIGHVSNCYLLQVAICDILCEMSTDVEPFLSNNMLLLWTTLAWQLETGQLEIKQASLKTLAMLIRQVDSPPLQSIDHIVDLMFSVLTCLQSGHDLFRNYKSVDLLAENLAACFQELFAENERKPRYTIPPSVIEIVMEMLSSNIPKYGLHAFKSESLSTSLCHLLVYIQRHIPPGYESLESVRETRMKIITQALIQQIHMLQNGQCVVLPLELAIRSELNATLPKEFVTHSDPVGPKPSTSDSNRGTHGCTAGEIVIDLTDTSSGEDVPETSKKTNKLSRRKSSVGHTTIKDAAEEPVEVTPCSPMFEKSSTLRDVLYKLDSLCQIHTTDNKSLYHVLEATRTLMEVVSRSCCRYGEDVRNLTNITTSTNAKTHSTKKSPRVDQRNNADRGGRDGFSFKNALSMWISVELMEKMCDLWLRTLQILAGAGQSAVKMGADGDRKEENDEFNHLVRSSYQCICTSIAAVLSLSGEVKLPSDFLHSITWIVCLPWLPMEANWLDLKMFGKSTMKEVGSLSSRLAEKLDDSSMQQCLPIVALLSKDVAPKWRIHVFKDSMTSSKEDIQIAVIQSLPLLLFNLTPTYYTLIQEHLHPLCKCESEPVTSCLAEMMGKLCCVLATGCTIHRELDKEQIPLHHALYLRCTTCNPCHGKEGPIADKMQHSVEPTILDASIISPFMVMLQKGVKTKLGLIHSLRQVLSHLDLKFTNSAVTGILNAYLTLVVDEDHLVRQLFSRNIKYLVGNGDQCSDLNIQAVISQLKLAFLSGKSSGNGRLQETVVSSIGELGKVAEGELLMVTIVSLLESLLSSVTMVNSIAYIELHAIAEAKGKTMAAILTQFKQPVCKFLVEAMHDAVQSSSQSQSDLPDQDKDPCLDIITKVANAFGFKELEAFYERTLEFLLPHIVSKASAEASVLLKAMARTLKMSHREMLVENFKFIFSYLVRTQGKTELEKALHYIQSETEIELGSLLRMDYQSLHNELLLHLSHNYSQVFSGLAMLASRDDGYKGPRPITHPSDMADFLQPRLLGILAFFDSQLLNSRIPIQDKKQALESLVCIMKLMGPKHITGVRVKVMTTLKIGLRYKEHGFPALSCKAWDCFIHSVDASSLGPMLSQVIVTLLPLLNQLPQQVSTIIHTLIIDNRDVFSERFNEIYFLPDIPELQEVNTLLKEQREDPSSQPDLRTLLKRSLKGVSHESVDVRIHALSNLRDLLQANQSCLHEYVVGSETVAPVINELVSVLLSGCHDSDHTAQNLFGECLGVLGAIDPGRLDLNTTSRKADMSKFHASVEDVHFAFDLINDLVRAFLAAADPRSQDCSAYAIQEMLQIFECRNVSKDGPGRQLWQRFPEHIQEILSPLQTTKYIPSAASSISKVTVHPIYRSKKVKTFKDWVCTWTSYLVTKVKATKPGRIFRACSMIIKHDIHTAMFLLPYTLLYALLDANDDDKQEIQNELLAVLTHAERVEDQRPSEDRHMSAQTVFSVLDHLTNWKRQRMQILQAAKSRRGASNSSEIASIGRYLECVKVFLQEIPQDILARASFNCRAYARSLMHFESYIFSNNQDVQNHLGFLQKLYIAMDEPDGVLGVSAIRLQEPSFREQIHDHESTGNLQDAVACYERATQLETGEMGHHKGLVRCLLDLGQLNTALVHVNGVLSQRSDWSSQLNSYRVEACWKLAKWDDLESNLKHEGHNSDWNILLGKTLLAAREGNQEEFRTQLQLARSAQMGPLSAASMEKGSYQRAYEYIARLHMLCDLDLGVTNLLGFSAGGDSKSQSQAELMEWWDARQTMAQSSFRTQEPMLCLRRSILGLNNPPNTERAELDKDIGYCWLKSAKVARKAGHLQGAYSSLLNAGLYSLPELCIEKAKWLWGKGDCHQALIDLQKGVAKHFSHGNHLHNDKSPEAKAQRLAHSKALLLVGRFMEDTAKFQSNSVMKQYMSVTEVNSEWEDGHFYLAKYYDRLMLSFADRPEKAGEFVVHVVKNFGQSLMYGNQYIYQSMPRLLTLWLDYGAHVSDLEKGNKVNKAAQAMAKLHKIIAEFTDRLAPYQFLTSFSQLISRICHSHKEVSLQLQEIIARVVVAFPQQAVWMSMAVSKSSYQMRQRRCAEIFSRAKTLDKKLQKFIHDATKLTDRLLDLCNRQVETGCQRLSINNDFRSLKRLLADSNFSKIIVPLQSAMTVTLPTSQSVHHTHDPFPMTEVYIIGFDDTVEVLPSLQRPKKIGIQGSDGRLYVMMCKPKDDLRKDNRLMEFNGIINKCLRKDVESRRRELHIRTYTVIPLNEECGLIEWVPNTAGLRPILHKIYREKGLYTSGSELKAMIPSLSAPLEEKLNIFENKLMPRYPPVFGEWFQKTFTDPTSWYLSRLAYARTSAVMSMVGYILGLGDRHGENILFDSTNGDCVHVDFNCLFNKGETFDWPERVPFRLTHNMVCAMGPMGYEGVFRRACEGTMKVMRDQRDPLMSVLKTFIYDPLVEWSKPSRGRSNALSESGEINNEKALVHVRDIEQRLQGILKNKNKSRTLPLSIEGHVDHLIREATNKKNLCEMYIGWAAYM